MTKLRKVTSILAVTLYATIILLPLYLALQRLVWVTGFSPFEWIDSLNKNYISQGNVKELLNSQLFKLFFQLLLLF